MKIVQLIKSKEEIEEVNAVIYNTYSKKCIWCDTNMILGNSQVLTKLVEVANEKIIYPEYAL